MAHLRRPELHRHARAAGPRRRVVLAGPPGLGGRGGPGVRPLPDASSAPRRTSRAADDAHRGALAARRRARRRAVPALRGRVRSARAVRHARALGRALRPGLGGRAPDLAPLRRRRGGRRPPERTRGPPNPGQLRRQAEHDRPLGRPGLRRADRARALGEHGGHRLHRPRALSRREGHLGQAGRHAVRAARPHSPARVTGRASPAGASARRSPPMSTSTPRSSTCSACRRGRARTARRWPRSLRGDAGARAGVGHRRRLRQLGAGDGRAAQVRPRRRRAELPALHVVQPLVHHARARPGGSGPAARRPTAGPASTSCRDRTSPSSASPSSPATASRSGWGTTPSTPTSSSTSTTTRRRTRTWSATAVEADMVELLRVALRRSRPRVSSSSGWASRDVRGGRRG